MTSDDAVQINFSRDPHRMRWLRDDHPYAQVRLPAPTHGAGQPPLLHADVSTEQSGDETRTLITLTNPTDRLVMVPVGDLAITLPLQDRYDDPVLCLTARCHAHLSMSGSSSYVLARRMGGEGPHLGLVLTAGELAAYSIERDIALSSNDRGLFLLHPAALEIPPGGRAEIGWTIFPCRDPQDLFEQALARTPFIRTRWDRHVLFRGEEAWLDVETSAPGPLEVDGAQIIGETTELGSGRRRFRARFDADALGDRTITVRVGSRTARTRLLVKEPLGVLLERRCAFLVEHQQYDGPWAPLRGALLAYDNEDRRVHYDRAGDFDGGRERVGMGILLAEMIRAVRDGLLTPTDPGLPHRLREGLDDYVEYVRRELVDEGSGEVFDDVERRRPGARLYNAPWFARFFLSLWHLDGAADDLLLALRIVDRFYALGGIDFYPIELPVLDLVEALDAAGLPEERDRARGLFLDHARRLAERGTAYPRSEVNFEQSIVGPAADILLQAHLLSGDEALLAAAHRQVDVLDQFQGIQSDHHLHEVAVRHWDGYWFGKRGLYGDTFPHYWSAVTGNVLALLARITGDDGTRARSDAALRAVLPLIHDQGTATAAHVFPLTVNGERAAMDDPLANDQDWALVFALRRLRGRSTAG